MLWACGDSETDPELEIDMGMPVADMTTRLDALIPSGPDQTVQPTDMSFADQGPLPCEPALGLSSNTTSARAFDLVRLIPAGGTGQWTFTLSENLSGGTVNRETGVYLAGDQVGVTDTIVLADEGCLGSAELTINVVEPMRISPSSPQVAPLDILRFEVTGGSGEFEFLLLNESGSAITEGGVYIAGEDLGWDLLQITDLATSQAESIRITLTEDNTIVAQDEQIFLPVGTRYTPKVTGGSGVYSMASDDSSVLIEGDEMVGSGEGLAQVTVSDAFLDRSTQVTVYGRESFVAPMVASSDGTASARMRGIPDINGDGLMDLVLGHAEADVAAGNGGALYIYATREDGTLDPEPAQIIAGPNRDDYLGWSFEVGDLTGDGISDLVVGVRLGDFGATNSGGVQVYPGLDLMQVDPETDGYFSAEPLYTFGGVNSSDFLGTAVTICDFNGDGRQDLAVAATFYEDRRADPVTSNQGAVFVYMGNESGLDSVPDVVLGKTLQDGSLQNHANLRMGEFGASLASGDFDGDGHCDLAAGSMRFESNTGLIHLFMGYGDEETRRGGVSKSPSMLITETRLEIDGIPVQSGQMGRAIEMGDVNADGKDDLVFSQMVGDVTGRDGGVTYLFLGRELQGVANDYTLVETADWFYGGSPYDYNGWSLDIADVNGDDVADILTASIYDDFPSLNNTGAVYAFLGRAGEVPTEEADHVFVGVVPDSRIGEAIAAKADEDGDGLLDLAVYANRSERFALQVGSLEVLRSASLPEGESNQMYPLNTRAVAAGQRFGQGMDYVGDIDNDGFQDAVVVSSLSTHQDAQNRSGTVWMYFGTAEGIGAQAVPIEAFPELGGSDLIWQATRAGDFDGDGVDDFAILLRNDERSNNLSSEDFEVAENCQTREGDQGGVFIFLGGDRSSIGQRPVFAYWGGQRSWAPEELVGVGDVNGDGFDDLVMGGFRWDDSAGDVGAFDVIGGRTASNAEKIQVICYPLFRQIGTEAGGNLGNAVTPLSDFDGDGCSDFAVAAEGENAGGPNRQGVVWIYRGIGGPNCPTIYEAARLVRGEANARLGSSLAVGDVDGDGLPDLLIGARNRNVEQATRGGAVLFFGHQLRMIETAPLVEVGSTTPHVIDTNTEAVALGGSVVNSEFGRSVAISGDVLAVGTPADQVGETTPVGTAIFYQWNQAAMSLDRIGVFVGETQRPGGRVGESMIGAPGSAPRFLIGGTLGNGSGLDNGSVYEVKVSP